MLCYPASLSEEIPNHVIIDIPGTLSHIKVKSLIASKFNPPFSISQYRGFDTPISGFYPNVLNSFHLGSFTVLIVLFQSFQLNIKENVFPDCRSSAVSAFL